MYLKKVERPRAVTLPDGSSFSLADLPDRNTRRWVASRKAAVVRGVLYGLISEADAEERYGVGGRNLSNGCALSLNMGKRLCGPQRYKSIDNFKLLA